MYRAKKSRFSIQKELKILHNFPKIMESMPRRAINKYRIREKDFDNNNTKR